MFLGTHRVQTLLLAGPKNKSDPETHSLDAAGTGCTGPLRWPAQGLGSRLRSLGPEPLSLSVGAGRGPGLALDGGLVSAKRPHGSLISSQDMLLSKSKIK